MTALAILSLFAFIIAFIAAIILGRKNAEAREDLALAQDRGDKLQDRVRFLQTREDQVRQVIDGARCILWDATVREKDGKLDWEFRILSPETSRQSLGLANGSPADGSAIWHTRVPQSEMQRMDAVSEKAIRGGSSGYHQEFTMAGPDGSVMHLREDVRIVPTGKGEWSLVGVQVDITALKQAQDQLAHERDLLHSLMDNIPDQIYFKNANSQFLRINKAVAETIGAPSVQSAVGKSDLDYFDKAEADSFRADDQLVMQTRKVLRDRVEHAVALGKDLWMSTTKAPLYSKTGEVVGLVGISRDITDRMLVEKALEHERDLLQALMDNIPDPIYFKDLRSHYIRINKADAEFVGATSAEAAVGKWDGDYFREEEAKAFRFDDQMVMRTGKALRDRVEQAERHGKVMWLSTTKAPIFGKKGEVVGMVGVTRDITDRVLAEQNLNDVVTRAQCILWRAEVTLDAPEKFLWNMHIYSSQQIRDWLGLAGSPGGDDSYNWSLCFDPEDRVEMEKQFPRAVRESLPGYQQEFRIHGKDQRTRWVSESVQISEVGAGRWNLVGVVTDITERKLAEQRIRESEARLRLLVEQMPAILWTCDAQLRFTYSVGSGLAALNLKPNQLMGMSLYEYFGTQDDAFPAIAAHRDALQGGKRFFETAWQGRVFQTYVEPQYGAGGAVEGVIGLAFDVTEQKQAQEALRDREMLLRRVLDTNPNIIFVKDAQGTILLTNAALAESYKLTVDEVTGRSHRKIHLDAGCDPQAIERWLQSDRSVISSGKPYFITELVMRSGGMYRWHRTRKLPITLANGTPAVLIVIEDVTDVKQAEKLLEKERDLLEALMDNIPDNIYFKDTQSRFIRVNRYQSNYLGLSTPSDAVGKTDFDFFPKEQADEFYTDERGVVSGQRLVSKVERIQLAGQNERWWLVSKVPFFDRDGRVVGIVGLSKDITDLKKMERQLAEANEQLNKLAREDALTGLMNRRMILELVDNEWARWQRYGKRFSVLVLDADNFKKVNDNYGHLAGDQALKFLAARINEAVRAVDIVGRYGGEEFIIILPETSQEGAVQAGEKILQNIRKAPLNYDGNVLNLTASIGAASVRTEDRNEEILLNRADLALLEAKKSGKDRVVAAPL